MNRELAEKIANTVLYEGYLLYPYRRSSLKNQQRWNFGTLYPAQYEEVRRGTERSSMHVECLLAGGPGTEVTIRVRFLQLGARAQAEQVVERALESRVNVSDAAPPGVFIFPGAADNSISGAVHFKTQVLRDKLAKLTIDLVNEAVLEASASRDQALLRSLLSAHIILYAQGGEFISLLDPPNDLRDAVGACRNQGCFPVLVGEAGEHDMLLCSPIILYDYPQIAPESAGDFFDATEIDEMLTLRVLTLTPEEKQAMREADERAREILERTEKGAHEQLAKIHGVLRSLRPVNDP